MSKVYTEKPKGRVVERRVEFPHTIDRAMEILRTREGVSVRKHKRVVRAENENIPVWVVIVREKL